MRTARFSSRLGGWGRHGVVCQGVSAWEGGVQGRCLPRGVYTLWTQRQTLPLHAGIHTPLPGGVGVSARGVVCLGRGVCLGGFCSGGCLPGGVCPGEVSAQGTQRTQRQILPLHSGIHTLCPLHAGIHPLPIACWDTHSWAPVDRRNDPRL